MRSLDLLVTLLFWLAVAALVLGTARRARVRIIDASVKEVELPKTQGLTGAFTTDQAERYTKGEFKDVWFYREDVEQHVERKYHPGA